jgi:hypothetical protein
MTFGEELGSTGMERILIDRGKKMIEHNPWKDTQEPPDRAIDPPEEKPEEPDWDSIRKSRELNEVLIDIAKLREEGL